MPKRATSDLDTTALARLLREQDGVVARSQLVDPRPPTRQQRQGSAVLACAPAALHRESASDAHGMTWDRRPGAEVRGAVPDRQWSLLTHLSSTGSTGSTVDRPTPR